MGAQRELKEGLKNMDNKRIQEYLCHHFDADWLIEWKPNPPAASHMGGIWERQIRTVRTILTSLTKEFGHAINDECFRTLLVEAENIVNSRPLTFPSSDPDDFKAPITPSSVLTMKSKIVMPPPGDFQRADIYLRKHWRRVQYVAEVFWSRWRKEYLHSLQQRTKWNQPKRNFKVGDIVLVIDERMPRNVWPLARITNVLSDSSGFVRSARVKTMSSTLDRPIAKLILVLEYAEDQGKSPPESLN